MLKKEGNWYKLILIEEEKQKSSLSYSTNRERQTQNVKNSIAK